MSPRSIFAPRCAARCFVAATLLSAGVVHADIQDPAAAAASDAPARIKLVGDPDPVDGIPRSTYVVIDQPGVSELPEIAAAAPIIFYMNRSGGTYYPGNNDSRTNRSSIVDQASTVSAWNVSTTGWSYVMTCLQDLFSRYNVVITDVDPGNVPHYESVIAGYPQEVGMQQGVGGVSPYAFDCGVIPNSIVFTFAGVYGSDYQGICETAAQEIAHSFGLDHEYLCEDPMTYLYNCGDKTFQDVAARCGEYSARNCQCGATTQNSVQLLTQRLGLAGTGTTPDANTGGGGGGGTPDANPGGGGGGGTPDAGVDLPDAGGGGGGAGGDSDDPNAGYVASGCAAGGSGGAGAGAGALGLLGLLLRRRRRR